jgi:hypothetical protein
VVVPIGTGTGERVDNVVVDDHHSVDQAKSDLACKRAIDWWNGSMATRCGMLFSFAGISNRRCGYQTQGDFEGHTILSRLAK